MPKRKPARLGILTVGMGAVSTTLFAGVNATRTMGVTPVGSLSQLGQLPIGAGVGEPAQSVRDLLSLAPLSSLVFGGWDLIEADAYEAAQRAAVLSKEDLRRHRPFLRAIKAFPGVANPDFTVEIQAKRAKKETSLVDQVDAIRADIRHFRRVNRCDRVVVLICMSVEAYRPPGPVHATLKKFEAGLANNDADIAPSQLYAYAALKEGLPVVNGTPNVVPEAPALRELAVRQGVPIAGSDFKSGQTYVKTVLAAGLRNRMLGIRGWFSTNILGNRDGVVLENAKAFEAKKVSKTGVLADIFDGSRYPELYGHLEHLVKINYYGPRGDNKEAWDSVDLFGWLGYPMEIKINFECRDSILAAPLALDLVLFADAAARAGESGVLDWLGFYFKAPSAKGRRQPSNDPAIQLPKLEAALRNLGARL